MSDSGTLTTVDEYIISNSDVHLSESERLELAEVSQKLFEFAQNLLKRPRPTLLAEHRESFVLSFTSSSLPQAKAGGFPPDCNLLSVTMGMIELLWRSTRALNVEEESKQTIRELMMLAILGHELTHVFFGHSEHEPAFTEGRAMEAHADFFAGLYIAAITHETPESDAREVYKAAVVICSIVIFLTSIGGDQTDDYHSAPVRFKWYTSGYYRWMKDQRNCVIEHIEALLRVPNLTQFLKGVIGDKDLRDRALELVERAATIEEDEEATMQLVHRFRDEWHRNAGLLEPIRTELSQETNSF